MCRSIIGNGHMCMRAECLCVKISVLILCVTCARRNKVCTELTNLRIKTIHMNRTGSSVRISFWRCCCTLTIVQCQLAHFVIIVHWDTVSKFSIAWAAQAKACANKNALCYWHSHNTPSALFCCRQANILVAPLALLLPTCSLKWLPTEQLSQIIA